MPVFYKYKAKHSWCLTWKYACIKAEVKYKIACYSKDDIFEFGYLNIIAFYLHMQKKLRVL